MSTQDRDQAVPVLGVADLHDGDGGHRKHGLDGVLTLLKDPQALVRSQREASSGSA